MITFDVVEDNGLEEGGADGPAPLPKIPMTKGKTLPSMMEVFLSVLCESQLRND